MQSTISRNASQMEKESTFSCCKYLLLTRKSLADIVYQKELIECLKALLNSPTGLEAVLSKTNSIHGIFHNLTSKNSVMKTQLLRLMAALALGSRAGYEYD